MKLEIVAVAEIAEMFGVSKQVVANWKTRCKDFPEPVANLAMGSIYKKSDIKCWGEKNQKDMR
jgi:chromosome partitioning protein